MRTFHNLWQHGARALNAGSDVFRFRIALGAVALGLALWLVVSADKPWKLHLTRASGWNLSELVAFFPSGRAH